MSFMVYRVVELTLKADDNRGIVDWRDYQFVMVPLFNRRWNFKINRN